MFSRRAVLAFCMALLISSTALCQNSVLRIAAAADLQPVLPAIVPGFEKSAHVKVEISYASSATLTTQILNGAPYDLFLAANRGFPQKVVDAKLALEPQPVTYAQGTLVLWASDHVARDPLTMHSLTEKYVRRIAVANPVHAPYGAAAMASIRNLGLMSAVRSKLVFAENIAQAAQFAQSGNADCALISKTIAITPALRAGKFVPVPPQSYPPIEQGAVVLRRAANRRAALTFLGYLQSPPGSALLNAHGLTAATVRH